MSFETFRRGYPVCPSCGYEHRDRDDFGEGSETDCHRCDKPFRYERIVDVCFTTWPVPEPTRPSEVPDVG